jgi:hypothetical protein
MQPGGDRWGGWKETAVPQGRMGPIAGKKLKGYPPYARGHLFAETCVALTRVITPTRAGARLAPRAHVVPMDLVSSLDGCP